MKAQLVARSKEFRDDGSILEVVIWLVPHSVQPCTHSYKYRLFFGWPNREIVRYDNEQGKGDHKHIEGIEEPYLFVSLEQLLDDFEQDIENWSEK